MFTNKLKLNPDKTEKFLLGNAEHMVPASSIHNLGVFDESMSMKNHIVGVVIAIIWK